MRRFLFVFDTTGSMSAWINQVTMDVARLSTEILHEDAGCQVGFIAYGDHGDGSKMIQDSTLEGEPTPSYTRRSGAIERWLSHDHRTGGADNPEAVECVLKHIADRHLSIPSSLPEGGQLIVFWVGDAGPHRHLPRHQLAQYGDAGCPANVDWEEQLQRLAVGGVPIYTALCGHDAWARETWNAMASRTGGISVDLLNIRNLVTTMIAVVKKETGGLAEYAKAQRESGQVDSEMEEILVDLGATCHD